MIHESGEDYLEAILILKNKQGNVRSIDLAKHMNYSKPSISNAVSNLRDEGYLFMDESGYLVLSDKGMEIASKIYERHIFFKNLLMKTGIEDSVAEDEACHIEHLFSEDSFNKIVSYVNKLDK